MYVKWRSGTQRGEGWEKPVVDGDTIRMGKLKVLLGDDGQIYRTYDGKRKFSLRPSE